MQSNIKNVTTVLNSVACSIFLILFIYLHYIGATNTSFSTWTDTVVLGASREITSMFENTNTSLLQICNKDGHTSSQLAMPLISFTLNDTTRAGTVFTSKNGYSIDTKALMSMVILISLGFHGWRIFIDIHDMHKNNRTTDHFQADFIRWIEYTLTSPLQIIIICSTIYMRNISDVTQLAALQGALTLSGWTLENYIWNLQNSKEYVSNSFFSREQKYGDNLAHFCILFAYSALCHIVIWTNIISRFLLHESNISSCHFGIAGLPPVIKWIVILQCVLFSLFGLVPLVQVIYIIYSDVYVNTFKAASLTYGVLSILCKGLLAVMFVKLITDGNCIYTPEGKACLY